MQNIRRTISGALAIATIAAAISSTTATAADPVGPGAAFAPVGSETFALGAEATLWSGNVFSNRAAGGYTAWTASGIASAVVGTPALPVIKASTVFNGFLLSTNGASVRALGAGGNVTTLAGGVTGADALVANGPDLWISDATGVRKYTPTGSPPNALGAFSATAGIASQRNRAAMGPDGNMWVVSTSVGIGTDTLGRYNPSTGALVGSAITLPTATADPIAIAKGPDNSMWLAQTNNTVARIDTTTLAVTEYPLTAGTTAGVAPKGIVLGPDGGMWITENSSNTVSRLSVTGTTFDRKDYPAPVGFGLQGLTIGADGNVWAIGSTANKIAKFGTVSSAPAAFTTAAPPLTAMTGTVYPSYTFTATGNPAPTFTATGLPAGLSLSSSGVLGGTPTATGSSTVTVTATNGVGTAPTVTFTIVVSAAPVAPTITPPWNPGTGTVGTPFTPFTFTATGTPTPTFSAFGTLPPGLTLSPAGVLSGTPTAAGSYALTVKASNSAGDNSTPPFNLVIDPAAVAVSVVTTAAPSSTVSTVPVPTILTTTTTTVPSATPAPPTTVASAAVAGAQTSAAASPTSPVVTATPTAASEPFGTPAGKRCTKTKVKLMKVGKLRVRKLVCVKSVRL